MTVTKIKEALTNKQAFEEESLTIKSFLLNGYDLFNKENKT